MSSSGGMPQFLPPPAGPPSPPGFVGAPYGAAPPGPPAPVAPVAEPALPRPAVLGVASALAVTASLQWLCGLTFAWLVATVGATSLDTSGRDGSLFHILNRFHYRMVEGLAVPLYVVPAASLVLGFLITTRAAWTRVAYTAVGLLALGWSGWLLRDQLLWWVLPALYLALATSLVWTPSAAAWYRGSPPRRGDPPVIPGR